LARHAHRIPIYSINGGPRPMIYVSRSEAERLEALGHARRISRLKAPALVMRFCALQRQPGMTSSSITSSEIELNALCQILSADSQEERNRARRVVEKIAAWPSVADDKAALVASKIFTPELIAHD